MVDTMKKQAELATMTIEHNEVPTLSQIPKKELDIFISTLELAIKDYYIQQKQDKSV